MPCLWGFLGSPTNSQSSPSVSTSTQSRSGTIISSHSFPVQGGRNTSSLSLKPQGSLGLYAPVSPTKYVGVPMSSHPAVYSQSASSSGAQSGASTGFASQGMSSTYSGSVQPQGTASQFAPGSLSSYPSVSLSSPQGAASQSAIVQSSRKQFTSTFTGSSGTQEGFSMPLTLQGSTTYRGSLQPQGTTSRFAPGSLSSYPSVSLSSPQGAASQSAIVQSSQKQFTSTFTGSSGTQEGFSMPLTLQGSTTYRGSLQPQGTTSQFAPGSPSSPQGAASQSATVQSSQKQFTSTFTGSSGTQDGFSMPLTLQGSTTYRGSLQPQGTTSQFAPGSPSSPQGAASQSATVQSSQKQFTSTFTGSSGTQDGFSMPLTLQGSTTYRGSLQPQGTTSLFAPGSLSSYPSVSLSSPQGAASQSATAQSSQKQFTSTYTGSSGTQSGSSSPFTLQGSTTYGESLQPQSTTSQFASASPSSYNCHCVSLSSPQSVASQLSQALQSYSVSQSQKSPRVQPSQGIQTPGATASQDSSPSLSSPMQSRFSSLSSAGGSSSGDSGQFVSAQGGSTSYGGSSLHSQSLSSKYTPGSHAYAKLGSSPLAVSTQSTSDQRSNGLYSSDSLRTQGLHMVKRPSRLSYQAPSDFSSSNKISKSFVTLQRPAGSNFAPSLGLSAQAPSVMFSGILQTAQPLRGSDV
ncbi:cell wall protein AWA1-like isoform X2 [Megalobrama amblycephala]|uniref:cell wall protein AWA1-like isoform X2 n=1 Tax=Megalobrama amblycephala TaxID=75352 RepID=UPI002013F193|nr:cell wall protein AWA1-like isoform X2 [Megalobrama amblycephala]